ncbi:hypothetical protein QTP86_034169, partial [Hemibagrus guttatus]
RSWRDAAGVVPPAAAVRPAAKGPGAAAAPELTESEPQAQPAAQKPTGATPALEKPRMAGPAAAEPRSARPDQKKPWSTEKSSVGSGAVLEPPALTEAGTEVQGNRMETPDTTPVQGDGGDVDMVDEPVFKVPNKRKKQGQDMLDVLQDSIWRGELPLSCRRALLTLLPKKGGLTHLKNWHLVSLLCTDCKLLSKALASRLTKLLGLKDRSDFPRSGKGFCPGLSMNICGRWKRLVPRMSYRGQMLVINNLAASFLWHKLACVDPPPNLLASIQALLVDNFWDGLHWIPQSVLHMPKEEWGQGLVQLASRTAAFCLQFLQRLLTGPKDLIWRLVAHGLLHKKTKQGLWNAALATGGPPIHGGRLGISALTILTSKERVQLMDYQITETNPAEEGSFPQLDITPDLDGSEGSLLECWGVREMDFGSVSGKLLYRACVQVLNKKKLSGRVDTPWRSVLGFNADIKPEWRALYKPPLTKRAADLQWRIFHGIHSFIVYRLSDLFSGHGEPVRQASLGIKA